MGSIKSHISDEEWERIVNDPNAETEEQRHRHILENYPHEELIEVGYIDADGNILEPGMIVAIPRRDHFCELGSLAKWERQKAHLIALKLKKREAAINRSLG